jgi:flavin reductase (DIM6/NTAB) family NADH-FMN oxidoreductase RutF
MTGARHAAPMEFDLTALDGAARYKLLTSLVIPRPIGWITSLNDDGSVNLAPYSFFNVLGNDPPIVAFGPSRRGDGSRKDTQRNVETQKEFVVNLVTPEAAEVMHASAAAYAAGESEVTALGLETVPAVRIRTPRLLVSPVHLECRYLETSRVLNNDVVFGQILGISAPSDLIDPVSYHIRPDVLEAVGRLQGPGRYATTRDQFDLGKFPPPSGRKS